MSAVAADLPQVYRSAPYFVRAVFDFTSGSTFQVPSQPVPNAREHFLVATKLGRNGLQRIQMFRDYMPGWDFGQGQPMSELAYQGLYEFLRHFTLPANKRPSVFLVPSGNLELAWENDAGQKFQVEFGPETIEYYREDTEQEFEVPASEAKNVATALSV